MGSTLMTLTLLLSSGLVYHWSYTLLWFKLGSLFSDISASATSDLLPVASNWTDGNEVTKDTFAQKFYTEYSLSSKRLVEFIRVLFSLSMVCYIVTIEIVLWQISSAANEQEGDFVTEWIWSLVSMSLSLILILLQPFFILISLLNKFFNDRFDIDRLIIFTSAILLLLITILRFLSIGPYQYSSNILTRLSISGVTIMAVLSGIASVSTIYYTFLYLWKTDKNSKRTSLIPHSASNSIRNKKLLIWARKSWIKRRLVNNESKINMCLEELKNLDNENLSTLAAQNRKITLLESIAQFRIRSNSLVNILNEAPGIRLARKCFEIGFLVYCCYRIILTFFVRLPKIILHFIEYPSDYQFEHFTASSDPLAVTLANILDFFLFNFNYQHDLDSLTSQISLFLSASLFICALSTVHTTISFFISLLPSKFQVLAVFAFQNDENMNNLPVHNQTTKPQGSPSMIKNLLISELAGIYVVATVLMIRSNLPFAVASKLRNMLGQKFTVTSFAIDCWFDEIYAISCLLTLFFIKLAERTVYLVNRKDKLHT